MNNDGQNIIRGIYKGYNYIAREWRREIMRNVNGYVQIPRKHPLYKKVMRIEVSHFKGQRRTRRDYDAAQEIDVHGGFTFGDYFKEDRDIWTKGYWLGWDYGHLGDCFYDHENPAFLKLQQDNPGLFQHHGLGPREDKHWSVEEAEWECKKVIDQLIAMEGGEANGPEQTVSRST